MQSNEHNPIAIRIGKIQKLWKDKVLPYTFKYINILAYHEDMSMVEGFLKLEASQHGSVQAVFHIMLTPFENPASFSYDLVQHWISEFEKEKEKHPELVWKNLESLKSELLSINKNSSESNIFLVKIIEDYRQCFVPDLPFYLGVKPTEISNLDKFSKWFEQIFPLLPNQVSILTVDTYEKKQYGQFLNFAKEKGINLIIPSLNMAGAYNELMTQGNQVAGIEGNIIIPDLGNSAIPVQFHLEEPIRIIKGIFHQGGKHRLYAVRHRLEWSIFEVFTLECLTKADSI